MNDQFESRLFLKNGWQTSKSTFDVLNKFSGDSIATVFEADQEQVAAAIAHCRDAFGKGVPNPYERSEILRRAADILSDERALFEATYEAETGFTKSDARAEVSRCIETFRLSGEEARRFDANETIPMSGAPGSARRFGYLRRMPIGPVAAITPFNSPLNTVAHKVAPAIAAGNPIILKPSSQTPLCGALIISLLLKAGWPGDLCALLQGTRNVGRALLSNPDIAFFTFTGSTEVGRDVHAAAGLRKTQLELGSIAFTIVAADANLDDAIAKICSGAFRKAGQVCTSVQTVLADKSILAEMTERLAEATGNAVYGDPSAEGVLTGPMISLAAAEKAQQRIDNAVRQGAQVVRGGKRDRSVLQPTLLVGADPTADVRCREMFAPVVSVAPFNTLDEAISIVNATPYGLASGLFTTRIDAAFKAAERLDVGNVHINNTSSARVDLMPYGGVKDSGLGREGPAYAMREMTHEKLVTFEL
ncbi:aldehyde dehydrogenase family protein [Hoeflea sp. G2-23]|uniref:Aldehyde dehydrogenase family protein n=2 Tax=Hoeflea algicola TaxID=2983763 RepID=A0ABT3Z9P8_9HYPH|nr:aldehyde dehydrogenase family protein [Hoeflea algicola]